MFFQNSQHLVVDQPLPGETNREDAHRRSLFVKLPHQNLLKINRNKRLGAGNFSCVFQGSYAGTPVAVKEIIISNRQKDTISELVKNEIEVSNYVAHPNIVTFMGFKLERENNQLNLLLVQELISGSNMENILYSKHLKERHKIGLKKKYYFTNILDII